MILQLSPDAPPVLQAAAAAVLWLHIGGASVGLVSGAVAMGARKGGRLHRLSGNVFFAGMIAMALVGAGVAPFLPSQQVPNTMAAGLCLYLVLTAWATVRRAPGRTGRFEIAALVLAVGVALLAPVFAWVNAHSPSPPTGPEGVVPYIFSALAALGAACDIAVIRGGGVSGPARIRRHLWRMSVALLIAAASFAGQPRAVPEGLRGSPLLFLPMLAVLVVMIYWLARTRRRSPYGGTPATVPR